MKYLFTSEFLMEVASRYLHSVARLYKNISPIALLLLLFASYLPAQSASIQNAIDTYKKNFYVWEEPESTTPKDSILTVLGRWAWGPCNAVDAKGNFAYLGNGPTLHILDISEPASPLIVGEYLTDGYIYDIEVRDNVAFVCTGGEVYFIDISNPAVPELISFIEISGVAISFAVDDSFVYVTTFSGYMKVIDISDLSNPFLRGIIPTLAELATCVETREGYVYIGSPKLPYMQIVDATNPDSLNESYFDSEGSGRSSFIKDTLLFIGSSWYTTYLKIYDISNPAEPIFIGHVEINDSVIIDGITISEDGLTAYLLCLSSFTKGIYSLDISDLNQPVILDKFSKDTQVSSRGISITQNTLVASYFSGLCILDSSNPISLEFKSFFPTGGFAQKIQVKDSLAFIASGLSGLWILDVSDPVKPKSISNINTGGYTSDLVVEDSLVYIVNSAIYSVQDTSRGLWIIDVSNISQPVIISHYVGIVRFPSSYFHPNSIFKKDSMVLISQSGGVQNDSTLEIIDISNPFSPNIVSVFRTNYSPYDLCISDTVVYLATADGGLRLVNISNPRNPVEISSILNSIFGVAKDEFYVYSSTSDFSIINVDEPLNPFLISSIKTHYGSGSVDLTVSGDYAYWAEYYLGVIDISDPENPVQLTTFLGKDVGRGVAVNENKIFFADQTMGVWVLKNDLITSVTENKSIIVPNSIELYQNYPNPFNSTTTIELDIPKSEIVSVEVFDVIGRKIQTLLKGEVKAGNYKIKFDSFNLSSGIYLYRLTAGNKSIIKKMVILK